jgi:integrase
VVFTGPRGAVMRAGTFRRGTLIEAAKAVGIPGFHPHELRHTAASLAIASGADIKVVQQMMGHKSATMTLDQYGHLFPDRLDVVADAMDAARLSALSEMPEVRALR